MGSRISRMALVLTLLAAGSPARAAFQYPLVSPQAAAMGSSSLAPSNDSTAMFLNPAGMARMGRSDAYFMYNRLYAGLGDIGPIGQGFLSVGVPTRFGGIGFGLGTFSAAGLTQERTIALSYALSVAPGVQVGVTGKQLQHSFAAGSDPAAAADPVFSNGTSRAAFALDMGMVATLADPLRLGIAVRNLNQPNVGLAGEDRVARELQAGLSYDIGGMGLKTTADLALRSNVNGGTQNMVLPALGLEKWIYGQTVAFRAGLNPLQLSGGIGVAMGRFGFDYALIFNRNLAQDSYGTHLVGVHMRFGSGVEKTPAQPVRTDFNRLGIIR